MDFAEEALLIYGQFKANQAMEELSAVNWIVNYQGQYWGPFPNRKKAEEFMAAIEGGTAIALKAPNEEIPF
jgi:hypothetical protein